MKKEINNLLDYLYSMAKSNTYNEKNNDIRKIIYILEKISKDETITVEELDLIEKIINDLDCKYDDLFELTNIFQPIHYFYKKKLKKEYVNKLREENRKKRTTLIIPKK